VEYSSVTVGNVCPATNAQAITAIEKRLHAFIVITNESTVVGKQNLMGYASGKKSFLAVCGGGREGRAVVREICISDASDWVRRRSRLLPSDSAWQDLPMTKRGKWKVGFRGTAVARLKIPRGASFTSLKFNDNVTQIAGSRGLIIPTRGGKGLEDGQQEDPGKRNCIIVQFIMLFKLLSNVSVYSFAFFATVNCTRR